ncbi:unnamed protein product [Adineta steineri]|uniref:RNA helicase aquarius n=1 Tax=Adineta steineri TaxID=433720 RepID=A0A814SEB1_9BILA|nr:unnamed protein product [Adineta steineri]CAF3641828.1 unnamed protein product [Adineta steineri]
MPRGQNAAPTVDQINKDRITLLSEQYWASYALQRRAYDRLVVDEIYIKELLGSNFNLRRIILLEFSQYLENFLWPNLNPDQCSPYHVISVCVMVNEKFRERVQPWDAIIAHPENFGKFLSRVMHLCLENDELSIKEQTILIMFLDHCFNSLELDIIRSQIQKIVGLTIWTNLTPERRDFEFEKTPKFRKLWKLICKKDEKLDTEELQVTLFERTFLRKLADKFLHLIEHIQPVNNINGQYPIETVIYTERFLELFNDIIVQLPTRRFFNVVLDDINFVVRCFLSSFTKSLTDNNENMEIDNTSISLGKKFRKDNEEEVQATTKTVNLFHKMLTNFEFYANFEINDTTGETLTHNELMEKHYEKVLQLQQAIFKHFREDMPTFPLQNIQTIDKRDLLRDEFDKLNDEQLKAIGSSLQPPLLIKDRQLLMEVLILEHERVQSHLEIINTLPLYPTEETIWDEDIVPTEFYNGETCLALPKLNLQFLTLHDYLLRNFHLFRLESTYEIRQDIEDSVSRMKPWQNDATIMNDRNDQPHQQCIFGGWSRMAQPITNFTIVEVGKANIGESHPSRVRADVTLVLNTRKDIKREWEHLRKHDICFLITCKPSTKSGTAYDYRQGFIPQVGLTYVRGCEIEGMLNIDGKVIEEGVDEKPVMTGDTRTWRVWLDPNQYQADITATLDGSEDVYDTFNILMRRKPKENNFKAVLETIRDLMNTNAVVPDWLQDLILGYGDPASAHYTNMKNKIPTLDWNDTFLDVKHLRASFPDYKIRATEDDRSKHVPPFRLTFCDLRTKGEHAGEKLIILEPYKIPNRGPYPYNKPRQNTVRFTPTQIEGIKSGMQHGLTLIVGPPGTGKTDVAVQIISNIYHNYPDQRTLIVTHSNQALNQLFEKIMGLDVDERHLLRLGHGEEELETDKDFSRYGRVNYILKKRLELLEQVERLQKSLHVQGDLSYTCETAAYFYMYNVLSRWEEYLSKINQSNNNLDVLINGFPFKEFFSDLNHDLFHNTQTFEYNLDIAQGCFRYIQQIFTQLEEFRSFELMRNGSDRAKYLLVREAKIIAMTCTHAALKRHDLVKCGFKYDNILMEEAAQILEIETFIPLLLQTSDQQERNRLKRCIMIGDHHQLPPVIKNMAFQKYSNMEQALFTRLVRLGVPTIDLDAQGRARASLCSLYNWRYKNLGNLEHVLQQKEFKTTNAGFVYDYQLINVENFNDVGESEPIPYFYQNLAEAEYIVATYMYMRLLGYPAQKISILTTYNGQKFLIRDVLNKRCAQNPLLGLPMKVATVDKYQGQQNDYILLSLVRTKAVGHLRDVRRLVVAMSRARLGLFIFGRVNLFESCFELTPAFNILTKRPSKLYILPNETYPSVREEKRDQSIVHQATVMENMPQMADFVYKFYNQKMIAYQEKKRQEELSRYDPERDLPYDPLQPSIRAPEEPVTNENSTENPLSEQINLEKNVITEYIPSRQHQVSGTSFRHDPNIESSTIENLDDDDDDEDVYDPSKPTLFQKIQSQTSNTTEQKQTTPTNVTSNLTTPKKTQGDEVPTGASEDDLNKSAIFRSVFHQDTEMDTIPALDDDN